MADYMERHPASTGAELAAACDVGSVTKVISAMSLSLGYGIERGSRWVRCVADTKRRRVRTYTLTHRPAMPAQQPLFPDR
jgi:hypothetical protein